MAQDEMIEQQQKIIRVQEQSIQTLERKNSELMEKGKELAKHCDLLEGLCENQQQLLHQILEDSFD